jgi:hypothetical protein
MEQARYTLDQRKRPADYRLIVSELTLSGR